MTEPVEVPEPAPEETPASEPETLAEAPAAPDEEEAAEEEAEPAGEPEEPQEASGAAGAVGEKELERMFKRVETANARYARQLGEIMGEEATVLEECPRCKAPFLGFIFPPMMQPVDADTKTAVLVSVGEQPQQVTERDNYSRVCDDCKGWGRTLSGSHVNAEVTLLCVGCKGRGWVAVGPERASGMPVAPAVAVTNGAETVPEPAPDTDPWGRRPGDPDYGRMPQYVGRT